MQTCRLRMVPSVGKMTLMMNFPNSPRSVSAVSPSVSCTILHPEPAVEIDQTHTGGDVPGPTQTRVLAALGAVVGTAVKLLRTASPSQTIIRDAYEDGIRPPIP